MSLNTPPICRRLAAGAASIVVGLTLATQGAAASLLTLGPRTLQTLIAEQLFNDKGRWYLIDDGGVCFTYLESPRIHMEGTRLALNARLTSRLGQRIGSTCAGADFASNVALSAKLQGSGHKLTLDDIRIDRVDDESTRNALNLALQLDPEALPHTVSIDLLEFMQRQVVTAGGVSPHVDQFRLSTITTRPDAVVIQFDLSLIAP